MFYQRKIIETKRCHVFFNCCCTPLFFACDATRLGNSTSNSTERIVLSRINDYLTSNSLLNPHQSGFTKRHSTETLITSLYNKLVSAISHQQVSCLCLLDISAAFDTIDHNILLNRLSTWFGFADIVLLWIQFYLSSRSFSVSCSFSASS